MIYLIQYIRICNLLTSLFNASAFEIFLTAFAKLSSISSENMINQSSFKININLS